MKKPVSFQVALLVSVSNMPGQLSLFLDPVILNVSAVQSDAVQVRLNTS